MAREYSATEQRNIASVEKMFTPPAGFDVGSLFADDAVWWNGHPKLREGPGGSCEHKGIAAIRRILGAAGTDARAAGIDAYDLTTVRNENVIVLADGDYVMRQHNMHAKTHGGRDYRNVYCFVFRFDADGRIAYLTEHWNTWLAHKVLFENFEVEPAHPLPDGH